MTGTDENMGEVVTSKATQVGGTSGSALQPTAETKIPQFRRDIPPSNIVLSAEDLNEFSHLVAEANERAKRIELANLNLEGFDSREQAEQRLNDFMKLEYAYTAKNGDAVEGLDIPKTTDRLFPEELQNFFISNATFSKRAIQFVPLNAVEAYFSFEKPSLKIDFQTMPSNPTENRSVINIYGRDEDWVISTADRINEFLRKRRTHRPIIHRSGSYDYFLAIAFLPLIIWLFYKYASGTILEWINSQTVFLNVMFSLYMFLLSLLLARFLFQYIRWLFPPIEYYKRSRVGAYAHRVVAGTIGSAVLLSAIYDFIKSVVTSLF